MRLFRARGEERQRVFAAADALRREVNGDDGHLRRDAERPVHERLLLPLRLLRVLEGQARREPARRAVPRPARGDRAPRRGGVGARRDGDLPPGRDPSRPSTATTTPRSCARSRTPCPSCTCTRSARSRSGRARRRSASRCATTSSGCATRASRRCRARRPRCSTTRCARSSARTRSRPRSGSRCTRPRTRSGLRSNNTIMFGHVDGPRSWARHLVAVRELAAADGRLHRVRAAAVRAHGGADLPARAARAPGRRSARCC